MEDGRCKLGLAGRLELVRLVEHGSTHRPRRIGGGIDGDQPARLSRRRGCVCGPGRLSRSPVLGRWALGAEAEQRILRARAQTNLGPARLAGLVGYRRSTIWKVLRRHGCSRRRRSAPRQTTKRFEWSEPGALLHIDTMQLARFEAPGHWATGDRRERSRGAGTVYVVSVGALPRRSSGAAAWMTEQGCGPVEAVMSDNHKAYTSHHFQALLAELGTRHIPTPPYTPRWNGKVERFHRTLNDEWARSQIWPTSRARDRALASFLRYYNRRRPHTSLGDRPPISRVHQDRGQDN